MQNDFTRGNVPALLMRFAIPIFLANLLQACYSIADMAIVGRLVGSAGLTAIDNASRICFLITSLCAGISIGGSVLVAQRKGAGDRQGLTEATGTLFALTAIASIAMTVICEVAGKPMLIAMRVPPEALPPAVDYLRTISLGTIFVFGYNSICGVMRGLGDSTSPLTYVACTVLINIALDILFVGPLGLGVRGAAIATVMSEAISFCLALSSVVGGSFPIKLKPSSLIPRRESLGKILSIGIPQTIQMTVLNLSYAISSGLFNSYGIAVSAAAGIGLKVNTVVAMVCWAVGQAVMTMAGQNLGAKDVRRAASSARWGIVVALAAVSVAVLPIQIFTVNVVSAFNGDASVVREGVRYLRIACSLNFMLYAVMYVLDSFATGAGDSSFAMMNAMLHSVVMRLCLSVLLSIGLGMGCVGLYWGESLSPILSCLVGIGYFASGFWKRRKR
ncbi:MAG TPA: MATE family efflux transporter [Treponemataceae bacterium]|nr:MATE family efflux transporter [Treponemataceae bacterium]HPS43437.1 MATE family efflux transporter [Treponemataceae bacterium]